MTPANDNSPIRLFSKAKRAVSFEVGKTYSQSFACDSGQYAHFTILARTAKTITTEIHGKTVRRGLTVRDGIESFRPFGSHSMAMIVGADDGEDDQ